ncbi:MAG: alpha/beta hydrolase [Clostridiales bacterium]|nr:alpha/beta hydrolase [Clostridiales bacterium]
MIISEDVYIENMAGEVEPWLDERKAVRYLKREEGHKIYCEFYRCDDPKGIVVISHGFTETAEKFREVIWMFMNAGYHVCIIDHCGHGRSYRLVTDPCLVHVDRFERYVEDLNMAVEKAAERWMDLPLYLWAHSMGGGIGASLTAAAPELFTKVILTSPMIRPLSGGVPWGATKIISRGMCRRGKDKTYVPGQHPYRDDETFEDSAATCRPRFEYYNEKRRVEPLFQMSGASYGWLHETARLDNYLMTQGYKTIKCPVLVFQADDEDFVSKDEQAKFVQKIKSRGGDIRLVPMPGTKHEIYSSTDDVLEKYWKEIFDFLS